MADAEMSHADDLEVAREGHDLELLEPCVYAETLACFVVVGHVGVLPCGARLLQVGWSGLSGLGFRGGPGGGGAWRPGEGSQRAAPRAQGKPQALKSHATRLAQTRRQRHAERRAGDAAEK